LSSSHSDRAWQLYALDRYSDALIEADKALQAEPDDPELHILRSKCFKFLGKKSEARKAVQQAIAADPEHARSYATSAWLFLHEGRTKEALSEALVAVRFEPDDPHSHYFAALAFSALGKHKEAREAIDYAIYLEPESSTYFSAKADIYNLSRDKKTALEAAEEALRLDPENADAFATRSRLLRTTRHHKEAVGAARESLRLDPTDSTNRDQFIEAKRSRFFLYRWILSFNEWVSSLPPQYRWVPTIIILIFPRVARRVPRDSPYFPAFVVMAFGCVIFSIMWYFGDLLLDAFLAVDPVDKYTLSPQERRGILTVVSCLMVGLAFIPMTIANRNILTVSLVELFGGFLIGALLYKLESLSWKGNLMFGWAMLIHGISLVMVVNAILAQWS